MKLKRPIRLNVGGKKILTTDRGILSQGGGALLRLFDSAELDKDGNILVERDPESFEDLLCYLKIGDTPTFRQILRDHEMEKKGHLKLVGAEAAHWGVGDLGHIVRQIVSERAEGEGMEVEAVDGGQAQAAAVPPPPMPPPVHLVQVGNYYRQMVQNGLRGSRGC